MSANVEYLSREFFARINAGKHEEAVSLMAKDAVWYMPASLPGGGHISPGQFLAALKYDMDYFVSQPQYTILKAITQDKTCVCEVRGLGDLNNGERYDNLYAFIFEVDGDKIISVHEYLDTHYAMNVVFV